MAWGRSKVFKVQKEIIRIIFGLKFSNKVTFIAKKCALFDGSNSALWSTNASRYRHITTNYLLKSYELVATVLKNKCSTLRFQIGQNLIFE